MKPFLHSLFDYLEECYNKIKLFIYIFHQEKVHKYFLILILLIFLSAGAFYIVEADNITMQSEGIGSYSVFSRTLSLIYWSIVTISTTGYGDIIPQTDAGRTLVVIILFLSIVTVSLFTANLASALTSKKLLESRGIMEIVKIKDHFVICGWKTPMGKFINDIIRNNPNIQRKK